MLTPQREEVFRHRIPIPGRIRSPAAARTAPAVTAEPALAEADRDVEAAMSDQNTRNLVFRFWTLTVSQRREIALGLGLIDRAELTLPEPERYGRALLRAGERGLLEQVAREVAQREKA